MSETLILYSQNELIAIFSLLIDLFIFVCATSIGVFTKELIFPKENTKKQNFGLAILAGIISFALTVIFKDQLTLAGEAVIFLLSIAIGFFIPSFKSWFGGKLLFKILFKGFFKNSVITEIEKELDKEE